MIWRCMRHHFDLTDRVLIMGILNVTPDSFSDGGRYANPASAIGRALELEAAGADIIDIGGESTRPGSEPVPEEEEIRRVEPVIRALQGRLRVAISIDTCKASVARAALEAGASIINDVTAMRDPEMASLAASSGAGLVLMHMQGTPQTMQTSPFYEDVVREVREFLAERRANAVRAGVHPEAVALDPGIGFGKTMEHNLSLLRSMEEIARLGSPLLVGVSRKSFLRKLLGLDLPPGEAAPHLIEANAAACAIAVERGASILRVHEPAAMKRAALIAKALRSDSGGTTRSG